MPRFDPEALIDAVQKAERSGDVAALKKLISREFAQHHSTGVIEPRDAYLDDRSQSSSNPATGRAYLERDVQWRRSGETAVRTSITRIRGAKPNTDTWVRSTAVAVREGGTWRLFDLDSALLFETPQYAPPAGDLPSGRFGSKESGPFLFVLRGGQPYLEFGNGREVPLIATATDVYWSGVGSTLTLARNSAGGVTSVTRKYGERTAWTASPVVH